MKRGNEDTLQVLKNELEFVQKGGYRAPLVGRAPLVFEDSPTCSKERCSACPDVDCVLINFVPTKCRYDAIPGRHIRLNETGEILDSQYRTGPNEEIEQTLFWRRLVVVVFHIHRNWRERTSIARLRSVRRRCPCPIVSRRWPEFPESALLCLFPTIDRQHRRIAVFIGSV